MESFPAGAIYEVVSAGAASGVSLLVAGILNNPEAGVSFTEIVLIDGGMGTMIGAVIGVVIISLAQFYLKDLMQVAADATAGVPLLLLLRGSVDAHGNPVPGWRTFWSLFGASNQLLAALTLDRLQSRARK